MINNLTKERLILTIPKEFDFDECLRFLARSDKECLHVIKDKTLWKLIEGKKDPILLKISQQDKDSITIDFPEGKQKKANIEYAKKYVIDWLDLDRDLTAFYRLAKKDPILKPLVKQFYGLRLIGIPNFFEALCWAILGQQINLAFAYTMKSRLIEKYGTIMEFDQEKYFLFPQPSSIANLTVDDLRPLQISIRKAEYLIGLAQKIEAKELSKTMLSQMTFEQAKAELVAIRGIGNWTANYVIMKCLRQADAFPIEDVGLHNALKIQMSLAQKPPLDTIRKLSKSWEGWRGYATFYLWQSLLGD